jgi:hypothetical protein
MDIIEDQIKGGAALADSDTAYDEVNVTLKVQPARQGTNWHTTLAAQIQNKR